MLRRCASFLKLNATASNSVKSWVWHFIDALLLRQLITAIVANNFPEFLRVEERHVFELHLSVRVVVEIFHLTPPLEAGTTKWGFQRGRASPLRYFNWRRGQNPAREVASFID